MYMKFISTTYVPLEIQVNGMNSEIFFPNKRLMAWVFTSASSVRGFFEIMSKDYDSDLLLENLSKLSVISIGPFTANELQKFNVRNTIAEVHTVAGAFEAMKNTLIAS